MGDYKHIHYEISKKRIECSICKAFIIIDIEDYSSRKVYRFKEDHMVCKPVNQEKKEEVVSHTLW